MGKAHSAPTIYEFTCAICGRKEHSPSPAIPVSWNVCDDNHLRCLDCTPATDETILGLKRDQISAQVADHARIILRAAGSDIRLSEPAIRDAVIDAVHDLYDDAFRAGAKQTAIFVAQQLGVGAAEAKAMGIG